MQMLMLMLMLKLMRSHDKRRIWHIISPPQQSFCKQLHHHHFHPPLQHPIISLLQSFESLHNQLQQHHQAVLKILHAHTITTSLMKDPFATTRILQFYFNNNNPHYAKLIFHSIIRNDHHTLVSSVYTWNAMIIGQAQTLSPTDSPHSPIAYYFQMLQKHVQPNDQTFGLLIKASNLMLNTRKHDYPLPVLFGIGTKMHAQILKHGVDHSSVINNSLIYMYCNMGLLNEARVLFDNSSVLDPISWNTMISSYGQSGDVNTARELFEKMPEPSLISWSALISRYVASGEYSEALRVFNRMLDSSLLKPDAITLVSVLKACANLGALDQGRWAHLYMYKNNLSWERNVVLGTALVDMYAKCGCLNGAMRLFNRIHNKDGALWNSVIGGLAMHGYARDALHQFSMMKLQGTPPNPTTFLTVLCACVHSGRVTEGIQIFESMKKEYGMEPGVKHYGCLADILGRAGRVDEAEELLYNMPMEAEASQWGALMDACRRTHNIEVGERVGKRLISMEPQDGGRYILLSNIYAEAGRWEDVQRTRREMDQKGAKKETGRSLIERDGVVHEFIVGDASHPQSWDIYEMLNGVEREVKKVGRPQDTSQLIDMHSY